MDKRMFLAVGLCLIVLAVFQTFFLGGSSTTAPAPAAQTTAQSDSAPAPLTFEETSIAHAPASAAAATNASSHADSTAPVAVGQAGNGSLQLAYHSAQGITAITLPQFRQYLTADTSVNFLGLEHNPGRLEFWGGKARSAGTYSLNEQVLTSTVGDSPVTASVGGTSRMHFTAAPDGAGTMSWRWTKVYDTTPHGGRPTSEGLIYVVDGEVKRVSLKDLQNGYELSTQADWVGLEEHYFIALLQTAQASKLKVRANGSSEGMHETVILDITVVLDDEHRSMPAYIGPKDTARLAALGKGLEGAVDFGWFALVARPMLTMLRVIEMGVHNWGIAIILLTLAIKLLLFPLQIKFTESMYRMQAMKPQMDKLREKFKDDAMRMNQELAAMYKREGINPLGGCLPVLMQIPIFVALYNVLANAIELRHAPFFGWIHDLSQAESIYTLHAFGFDLPLRVLPVLMMGSTLLQNKLTPTTIDNEQQRMMMTWMPIIFTVLFYSMPSGLMVYWLSQNLITVGQNELIKRRMAARGLLPVSAAPKK